MREVITVGRRLSMFDAECADMTTDVEESATEVMYECECCGAGAVDLHAINTNKDFFLTACQICGHSEIWDKIPPF